MSNDYYEEQGSIEQWRDDTQEMPTTQSAGVILFSGQRNKVLMVQQYGETWSFPKGHVENGESLKDCAFRELEEETGINLESDWITVSPPFSYSRESIGGAKEMKEITLYPALLTWQRSGSNLHSDDDAITAIQWVNAIVVCNRLDAEEDRKTFLEALSLYGSDELKEWASKR
jgi:8-oxo-dGTP pyrophosphatase MutT (NUDIX family)